MAERGRRRRVDPARRAALTALGRVNREEAYANLVLDQVIAGLATREAALATELVHGTCRMQGSYDQVIVAAGERELSSLQPAVVDVLRLACHQLFAMRIPTHAAVDASVNLAGAVIGERVCGLVNAICRRLAAHTWEEWVILLSEDVSLVDRLALRHGHPAWIVQVLWDALGRDWEETASLLAADNVPAVPMLVVRPGLAQVTELAEAGAEPATWSPWGARRAGNPADLPLVRQGLVGVQDEGSQLVIRAALSANIPDGPWLDMCAGPGGKSALLRGCAPGLVVSAEIAEHRARLVAQGLRAYPPGRHQVVVADGSRPAWRPDTFALSVADVPCSGLGALRRRPESRWRRGPEAVRELTRLQRRLLAQAVASTAPGGVVAYITCSPVVAETVGIIGDAEQVEILDAPALIPEVPQAASRHDGRFIQLWPHIHGTDAMFCALLRRRSG